MDIEDLVLSLDQMHHLKELGVEVKDTAMVRYRRRTDIYGNRVVGKWHFVPLSEIPLLKRFEKFEIHKTLTLQEILEMLPEEVKFKGERYFLRMLSSRRFLYTNPFSGCAFDAISENVLKTAYNMLCWVAEHGYLNKE